MDAVAQPDRAAIMEDIGTELYALECEYGPGTVNRLLRHLAIQLNLSPTKVMSAAEHKRAFPVDEYPKLYTREGDIRPELLPGYKPEQPAQEIVVAD